MLRGKKHPYGRQSRPTKCNKMRAEQGTAFMRRERGSYETGEGILVQQKEKKKMTSKRRTRVIRQQRQQSSPGVACVFDERGNLLG